MSAEVITFSDQPDFDAQGTIVYDTNFDDFANGQFSFPSTPFTRGDVTDTSSQNLIVNTIYSIGLVTPVMSDNFWQPLTGTIAASSNQYDLFGFDLAMTSGPVDITIDTNLGTYSYDNPDDSQRRPGLRFRRI